METGSIMRMQRNTLQRVLIGMALMLAAVASAKAQSDPLLSKLDRSPSLEAFESGTRCGTGSLLKDKIFTVFWDADAICAFAEAPNFDWTVEFAFRVAGIPDKAVDPAPQGQLGLERLTSRPTTSLNTRLSFFPSRRSCASKAIIPACNWDALNSPTAVK